MKVMTQGRGPASYPSGLFAHSIDIVSSRPWGSSHAADIRDSCCCRPASFAFAEHVCAVRMSVWPSLSGRL